MSLDALPINVFDVVLLVALILGLTRGRKHGMSEELVELLQWICVVISCKLLYQPLGETLERVTPLSLLTCYVLAYISTLLAVLLLFMGLRRIIGGKLVGSDFFGVSEFYLGMISGTIRFACVLLAGLALLNARSFSEMEVRAMQRYQDDVYGSNYFPGLHSLQSMVFQKSMSGPWIRENLGDWLIKPTAPSGKALHQREYTMPY